MGDVTTFSSLEEKYDKSTGAEALFFANGHNKALRVEAHTLHVEFTDGAYIGRGASSRTDTDAFAIVCFSIVKIPKVSSTTTTLRASTVQNSNTRSR
jgi:hypothetical protein